MRRLSRRRPRPSPLAVAKVGASKRLPPVAEVVQAVLLQVRVLARLSLRPPPAARADARFVPMKAEMAKLELRLGAAAVAPLEVENTARQFLGVLVAAT